MPISPRQHEGQRRVHDGAIQPGAEVHPTRHGFRALSNIEVAQQLHAVLLANPLSAYQVCMCLVSTVVRTTTLARGACGTHVSGRVGCWGGSSLLCEDTSLSLLELIGDLPEGNDQRDSDATLMRNYQLAQERHTFRQGMVGRRRQGMAGRRPRVGSLPA